MMKNRAAARWIARSAGMIVGGYAAALGLFSAVSRSTELMPGDAKYFCEIDCHLAYSVAGTETLTQPAATPEAAAASREIVRLKVWFDPSTISPHRGNGPLRPNPRAVSLVGSDGQTYAPSERGMVAYRSNHPDSPTLEQPLRPGEAYTAPLVFDLPRGVMGIRLVLKESDPITRVLIGHENSPFHGKASFLLPNPGAGSRS